MKVPEAELPRDKPVRGAVGDLAVDVHAPGLAGVRRVPAVPGTDEPDLPDDRDAAFAAQRAVLQPGVHGGRSHQGDIREQRAGE